MLWLIYCGFFVLMLFNIFRMLRQRGKWGWWLFLGLIASAAAYVGLFVLPVASASALQGSPVLLGVILIAGTLLYAAAMIVFVCKLATKMKAGDPPAP
jgi:hypothetical protein